MMFIYRALWNVEWDSNDFIEVLEQNAEDGGGGGGGDMRIVTILNCSMRKCLACCWNIEERSLLKSQNEEVYCCNC